jgi:hypothetical protein
VAVTVGYSGSPQARKLGLKAGQRVALDGAPQQWALDEPCADLIFVTDGGAADVVLAFFRTADELGARLPALADRIRPSGALWTLWPRRAGGHTSDLTDSVIRAAALPLGIVDVKVAAVDADWSGQRYVWRRAARP